MKDDKRGNRLTQVHLEKVAVEVVAVRVVGYLELESRDKGSSHRSLVMDRGLKSVLRIPFSTSTLLVTGCVTEREPSL